MVSSSKSVAVRVKPAPPPQLFEPLKPLTELSDAAFARLEQVARPTVDYVQVMLLLGTTNVENVYEVRNEALDMQYAVAVSGADKLCSQRMLHGTSTESVDAIVREGFKVGGVEVNMRHGAGNGKGIYLTAEAGVAVGYSKRQSSKYLVLSETCVTPGCFMEAGKREQYGNPVASEPLYRTVVQPDKTLVRPLYVVEFRSEAATKM